MKGGFLSLEAAREHNSARKAWMRAEREALKRFRKLSALELGRALDATAPGDPVPLPLPEAKVVKLVQPQAPRLPPPQPVAPEVLAEQQAVVADLAARRAPKPAQEAPKERFQRALELERAQEAGTAITGEQLQWLRGYQTTPEYRAERAMWADFGDTYFG